MDDWLIIVCCKLMSFSLFFQCEDGVLAVEAVKASMSALSLYDCILMDEVMPNMNGSVATALIREMGYRGTIVSVTGNVLPEDKALIMSRGADYLLPKPLKVKDLEKILFPNND